MEETSNYLFVYGTLLDEKNQFGAYLKNHCSFFQQGKFRGKLYNIGNYPGAIAQPGGDTYVFGSIFILNDTDEILKILDEYEGVGPANPQPTEYTRELIGIEARDEFIKCWVYLYNRPVENLALIKDGRYLRP
jgi:gamma-glutamylcyclotransferase (GGCT)/AIG2-like uncharacterized protein YtfP